MTGLSVNEGGTLDTFDASGTYFASLGADQRLRVFATATNALLHTLHEQCHLAVRYSCVTIVRRHDKHLKKRKADDKVLVALGTETGGIVVWDLTVGEIVHRLDKHSSRVTALCFNTSGSMLYSCGDDKCAFEWSITTGTLGRKFKVGKRAPSAMCLSNDDSTLAIAATSIRLIDVSSAKCISKLVGHASSITSLRFSTDTQYLYSTATNDRFVNQFCIVKQLQRSKRKPLPATATFSATQTVKSVMLYEDILAAKSGAQICVWRIPSEGVNETVPEDLRVSARMNDNSSCALHAARFISNKNLMVCGGDLLKPLFRECTIDECKTDVLVNFAAENMNTSRCKKKRKQRSDVNAIDCVDPMAPVTQRPRVLTESVKALGNELGRDASHAMTLTLEERVRQQPEISAPPQTGSLETVLCQALLSDDKSMIEYCFRNTSSDIIDRTVDRISTEIIVPLLHALVERVHRNSCCWLWLRAMLVRHAAYMLSAPLSVDKALKKLHSSLKSRLSMHEPLLRLCGRLQLLDAQRNLSSVVESLEGLPAESQFNDCDDEENTTHLESEDEAVNDDIN